MKNANAIPCPVCKKPLDPKALSCPDCRKFDPHGRLTRLFMMAVAFFGVLFFMTYLDKKGFISLLELWKLFVK
jgi:predicted amidophosphoribosyltransferase